LQRIISALVLGTFFLIVQALPAAAQDQGAQVKLAVINVEAIRRASLAVKSISEQIGKHRSAFQAEIQKEEEALRNANQELARQRTLLSAEAFAAKRQEFEQKVTSVQRLVQERKLKLDRAQGEAMGKVQDTLNEIVTTIANERELALILSKEQTILAAKPLDITAEVLSRLDKALPAVKVSEPVTPAAN